MFKTTNMEQIAEQIGADIADCVARKDYELLLELMDANLESLAFEVDKLKGKIKVEKGWED
jgi:hypothetical protein